MSYVHNTHIPRHVRERFGVPSELRMRAGLPLMYARFGASDPLDEPGGYRYSISESDRRILEQAIRDTNSADLERQKFARAAILAAVGTVPVYGPILRLGGTLIMNWLGFGVEATFGDLSDEAGSKRFRRNPGAFGGDTGWTNGDAPVAEGVVTSIGWEPNSDGTVNASVKAVQNIGNWFGYEGSPTGFLVDEWYSDARGDNISIRFYYESEDGFRDPSLNAVDSGYGANGWRYYVGDSIDLKNELGHDAPFPERTPKPTFTRLVGRSIGGDDPNLRNVDDAPEYAGRASIQSSRTIDAPSGNAYLLMEVNDAPGNGASDYPQAGAYKIVAGPFTADAAFLDETPLPDLEGITPTGPLDPALSDLTPPEMQDLIDDLKENPDYQPYLGNPESDPGDISIPDPADPNAPPLVPGEPLGTPLEDFRLDNGIGQAPLANMRIPDPGEPYDDFMPGKPFKGGIGDEPPFDGKIGDFRPPGGGPGGLPGSPGDFGEITAPMPPYTDEFFTKPRCYKNKLASEIAKELAIELGMSPNVVVAKGCTKRFTGCFKKGSSKFDAMWFAADLCGYGIFPDPNGPGEIGPITPLPVFWEHHENRDLFVFGRNYSDLDMPSHVEYYRPHFPNRPGFSVVVPVDTIYALPADKWISIACPLDMTQDEALDAAARKAKEASLRGLSAEFAVPLNQRIKLRHQVTLKRPSKGFDVHYMVTAVRHDCNEEGFVTVCQGSELRVWRYAPRFEYVGVE